MSRNRKPSHPLVKSFLKAYRQGKVLPLAAQCPRCGPGYLDGSLCPFDQWRRPLGVVTCPACGWEQLLYTHYQGCINGRCKRVLHLHLGSRALQAAVALMHLRL
jgi:ribosomal protein S27AE